MPDILRFSFRYSYWNNQTRCWPYLLIVHCYIVSADWEAVFVCLLVRSFVCLFKHFTLHSVRLVRRLGSCVCFFVCLFVCLSVCLFV